MHPGPSGERIKVVVKRVSLKCLARLRELRYVRCPVNQGGQGPGI